MQCQITPGRTTLSKDHVYFFDPCPQNEKVILMLHGLGSDFTSWQLQMPELISAGYRPIAVDIPGFGQSKYPYRIWTVRRVALMIIKQVIDPLQRPVILMGLSLGGVVAQKIVQYRSEEIEKLILVSTFAKLHPKIKKNLPYLGKRALQIFSGKINKQASLVADHIFPGPEQKQWHDYLYAQIKNANPRIYRQAMVALSSFNSGRWMKLNIIPCLVITGSVDNTVTVQDQDRLASIVSNSEHLIIDGAGHAVNVDHTPEFNRALLKFLKS